MRHYAKGVNIHDINAFWVTLTDFRCLMVYCNASKPMLLAIVLFLFLPLWIGGFFNRLLRKHIVSKMIVLAERTSDYYPKFFNEQELRYEL